MVLVIFCLCVDLMKTHTVKPALMTSSEYRQPVYNGQFDSSTTNLNLNINRHIHEPSQKYWGGGGAGVKKKFLWGVVKN